MAPPPPKYEVIYMMRDGTTVHRHRDKSPAPASMYFYRPKQAVFFTRYYPMFKVWRVFDLRLFWVVTGGSYHRPERVIAPSPSMVTEDRDAAVMWMGLNLNA